MEDSRNHEYSGDQDWWYIYFKCSGFYEFTDVDGSRQRSSGTVAADDVRYVHVKQTYLYTPPRSIEPRASVNLGIRLYRRSAVQQGSNWSQ